MKKQLLNLINERDLEGVGALALQRRRALGSLVSLTYDLDPETSCRAVEALGAATERVAAEDPQAAREVLRRLNWLITEESGGICWRAPEGMAEITARLPDMFGEYVPMVLNLLNEMAEEDLAHFRPGILWGIGRLGALTGDHLAEVLPSVIAALKNSDPQARGMAVWALGETGHADCVREVPEILTDTAPVQLYEHGTLTAVRVCDLAARVTGASIPGN